DANGGIESIEMDTGYGSVTALNTAGLTSVTGAGTQELTLTGTVGALNAALNGLVYQAPAGTTSDFLVLTADDNGHTGPVATTTQLVIALTVDAATDIAPTVVGPSQQTFNGAGVTFATADGTAFHVADGDANGASETAYVQVLHGALTVAAGG